MTSDDWSHLAKLLEEEHDRLWRKHYPMNAPGVQFALEIQSYSLVAHQMATYLIRKEGK